MIIIMVMIVITQYSKCQFKICFNKVIGFLKNSTLLTTRFAAKAHLAVGEFLLLLLLLMMMIIIIIIITIIIPCRYRESNHVFRLYGMLFRQYISVVTNRATPVVKSHECLTLTYNRRRDILCHVCHENLNKDQTGQCFSLGYLMSKKERVNICSR